MVSISGALVLNIGTLTTPFVESMILAGKKANELNIPVVLDCVGVGATDLRTRKALEIIENVKVGVIKGNSGEIGVLAGANAKVRGVEAAGLEGDPIKIAQKLAKEKNATVVITGKEDIVTNGEKTVVVKNGHELMGKIVGTGCMSASVIGSFCAVEKDFVEASTAALVVFEVAGELAAQTARGTGSFKELLFDELYNLTPEKAGEMQKVQVL